jgi:hypothetical protein
LDAAIARNMGSETALISKEAKLAFPQWLIAMLNAQFL